MRNLAALLIALPLAAAAQYAPPPEAPLAAPATLAAPPAPPGPPAPPSPPALTAPAAQPAQPSPPPPYPPVYAIPPQGRDTWYIGFGLGGGAGRFKDDTGSYAFSDGMTDPVTVFLNFKVGATLTPRLLVGFDISALRTGGTVSGLGSSFDAAIQVSNYDAMLTWFPMERGLFLRGGLGVSRITFELTGIASSDFNGVNATVGGGYAFWLGRTFNLTLNLDFSAQSYSSSTGPSTSNFTALWVGFDWY